MSKHSTKLSKKARNLGLSAFVAASVFGSVLYEQSTHNRANASFTPPTTDTSNTLIANLLNTTPKAVTNNTSSTNNVVNANGVATATATATETATPTETPLAIAHVYNDGDYTGNAYRASHWGEVQVQVSIANDQITNVQIVNYPHSTGLSIRIAQIVLPYLSDEVIQRQSAATDLISSATLTSMAFRQSMQSALDNAKNNA